MPNKLNIYERSLRKKHKVLFYLIFAVYHDEVLVIY